MTAKKRSGGKKGIIVKFSKEKDTRRTRKYKEDGKEEDQAIGSIYVKNTAAEMFGGSLPETLKVTIE